MGGLRYRYVVLLVGALGAGAFSVLRMGLPSLGPALRDAFGLSLAETGLAFTAVAAGVTISLVPWGMLTDRIGERPVLAGGLTGTALALAAAALTPGYPGLLAGLFAAGVLGASSTGASGRAIMGWFARRERGFALGVRQMALPAGGALGSISLPLLAGAGGLDAALLALAGVMLVAALAGAIWLRDAPPPGPDVPPPSGPSPGRDRRIWRLGTGSALLVLAQSSVLGFLVLFLHDERGLSTAAAAACLAGVQVAGAIGRIVAGRRSDREERRIAPIRRRALVNASLLALTAALAGAPLWLLLPVILAAGVATMTWNGLAFTAAAELAGRTRAATAMGLQNTLVSIGGTVAPTAFGALVGATAYTVGFAAIAVAPLAAWAILAPLVGEEDRRAEAREARRRASATLPVPQPAAAKGAT